MKWLEVIRWLSVIPSAIVGWYIALVVGMAAHSGLNDRCPYGEVVSGMCDSTWFNRAEKIVIPFFVGLSAVLVVLMATLAAPTKKCSVAKVAFAVGLIIAAALAFGIGEWSEFIVACGAGLATSFLVCRRQRARTLA